MFACTARSLIAERLKIFYHFCLALLKLTWHRLNSEDLHRLTRLMMADVDEMAVAQC